MYDWNWYEVFEVILEITAEVVKAMIEAQDTIYVDFLRIAITKHRLLSSVQKMQSMITISIMSGLFKSESIKNCIIVLDVFNEANEKRDI